MVALLVRYLFLITRRHGEAHEAGAGDVVVWRSLLAVRPLFPTLPDGEDLCEPAGGGVHTPPKLCLTWVTSEHWQTLLTAGTVSRPLSKSLLVATWTMLGAIGLAAPAAYVWRACLKRGNMGCS